MRRRPDAVRLSEPDLNDAEDNRKLPLA
jgi:hypothetical protein